LKYIYLIFTPEKNTDMYHLQEKIAKGY
jgi:hypothetical protein